MKFKVFSVRDSKGGVFNAPFCKLSERDAEHDFRTLINDERSLPSQYPKDFDLYLLGEYDDQTGKFSIVSQPQHLAEGINMVRQKDEKVAKATDELRQFAQ